MYVAQQTAACLYPLIFLIDYGTPTCSRFSSPLVAVLFAVQPQAKTQEAASHLPPTQKAALLRGTAGDESESADPNRDHGDADKEEYRGWRDHK